MAPVERPHDVRSGHVGAAGAATLQDPKPDEVVDRAAKRHPADAELLREHAFGGDLVARREVRPLDHGQDGLLRLHVGRLRGREVESIVSGTLDAHVGNLFDRSFHYEAGLVPAMPPSVSRPPALQGRETYAPPWRETALLHRALRQAADELSLYEEEGAEHGDDGDDQPRHENGPVKAQRVAECGDADGQR